MLHSIILYYLPYPVKQTPAAQLIKLNATEQHQQPNYGILRMTSLDQLQGSRQHFAKALLNCKNIWTELEPSCTRELEDSDCSHHYRLSIHPGHLTPTEEKCPFVVP